MSNKLNNPFNDFVTLTKDSWDFGFTWPDKEAIIAQVISECTEIKQAIDDNESPERIQEEMGDLLHAAASLCMFAGFDPEQALANMNKKFTNRIKIMKELTSQLGLPNLQGKSNKFRLELWDEAKKNEIPV